jgi:hypothetical protein
LFKCLVKKQLYIYSQKFDIFGACPLREITEDRGGIIFLKIPMTSGYGFMDKRNDVNIQKANLEKLKIIEVYWTNLLLPTE